MLVLTIAVFFVGAVGLFFVMKNTQAKTAKQSRPPLPTSNRGLPSVVPHPRKNSYTNSSRNDESIVTDFTPLFTLFDNDCGGSSSSSHDSCSSDCGGGSFD